MDIFLSPHDDDQALFGSFICIRNKPLVIVCLDSYIQPLRGEVGCSAEERAAETKAACRLLGCPVHRLRLRDDNVTQDELDDKLLHLRETVSGVGLFTSNVFAPALQGGNKHHDMVSISAAKIFGNSVLRYTTYTKDRLYTTGTLPIIPTQLETRTKQFALSCYSSQLRINRPHFEAVLNKSEWLTI